MIRFIRSTIQFSLVAFVFSVPAVAEPADLATILPESTLLYISHSGSEQTAAARKGTAFGKMLADPQIQRMIEGIDAAIDEAAKEKLGEKFDTWVILKRMLGRLWGHPTALALLDMGMGEKGPSVDAALICRAGKDAAKLDGDLVALEEITGMPVGEAVTIGGHDFRPVPTVTPITMYHGVVGKYFVVAFGKKTLEELVPRIEKSKQDGLATSAVFREARGLIHGKPEGCIFTFYLNTREVSKRIRVVNPGLFEERDNGINPLLMILNNTGLTQLRGVFYESYYHGDGCLSGLYTAGSADANGEPSAARVTPGDLSVVPRTASWAWVGKVNLGAAAKTVYEKIDMFSPEFGESFKKWLTDFEADIGFCVDDGLLQLLGDTVVVLDAPDSGGMIFTGITFVFHSTDAEKLQTNLRRLVKGIAKRVGKKYLAVGSYDSPGGKIEFANIKGVPSPVAPAWGRQGEWVVFGLYPQVVAAELSHLANSAKADSCILSRPDVAEAQKILGATGSSVSIVDTKAGVEAMYPYALLLAQVGCAAAQGEGVQVDVSMLPTRAALTQHLFADVSTTRAEKNGTLVVSYGPLPFNPAPLGLTSLATTSMIASVALPSLSRARELSKRTVCASNMRGIGQAMYIHAQDHDGAFAPDFKTVVNEDLVTEKQFLCPSSEAQPGDLNACYAYIPGQNTIGDPSNVVLYEKPGCHQNEGGNVLFQDGHVAFMKPYSEVERLVAETKERMAKTKKLKAKKVRPNE